MNGPPTIPADLDAVVAIIPRTMPEDRPIMESYGPARAALHRAQFGSLPGPVSAVAESDGWTVHVVTGGVA